jgi:hypothetical protein
VAEREDLGTRLNAVCWPGGFHESRGLSRVPGPSP